LTAAVVVAGNDPKPPLTKAEKAKNKEAWKKAEASVTRQQCAPDIY
jgi:hypothetical protein